MRRRRRARGLAGLALLAWGGCGPTEKVDLSAPELDRPAPEIEEVSVSCSVEDAAWSIAVDTVGWTGGGRLWMALAAASAERHVLPSVSAASDGSTDRLRLDLGVVADWRSAEPGSTTRWRCAQEAELSFLLTVLSSDGAETADCRFWGADLDLWSEVSGAPACDRPLQGDDTGDTASP